MKISLQEYSLIINKHNQKLISIWENQKIYEDFLKILIFRVSLSRTRNISISRKSPQIVWFSNILISFWLYLFIIFLYVMINHVYARLNNNCSVTSTGENFEIIEYRSLTLGVKKSRVYIQYIAQVSYKH